MKILLINGNNSGGGAAYIAKSLCEGLRYQGLEVHLIVARGKNEGKCDVLYKNIFAIFLHRIRTTINGNVCFHNLSVKRKIIRIVKEEKIDIIHFHNIANNYFGFEDLKDINKYCRVVWTLHELWAVTGHCYHPLACQQWISKGCTKCVHLDRPGKIYFDISGYIWKRKKDAFTNQGISFVVPSDWMKKQLMNSFLKTESIKTIHNGISIEQFYVLDRYAVKKKYEISMDKKVILFISADLNNWNKGLDILEEALLLLDNKDQFEFITVGKGQISNEVKQLFNVKELGYISNNEKLNEIMNLADILVMPSKAESFSLVTAEALAAGTPVIAFDAGGVTEIINEETGWIVPKRDANMLKNAIEKAFSNPEKLLVMREKCRCRAEIKFSLEKMCFEYASLYEEILKKIK